MQDPQSVLTALFTSESCLLPDPVASTLTVRLHHSTTWGRECKLEKPISGSPRIQNMGSGHQFTASRNFMAKSNRDYPHNLLCS